MPRCIDLTIAQERSGVMHTITPNRCQANSWNTCGVTNDPKNQLSVNTKTSHSINWEGVKVIDQESAASHRKIKEDFEQRHGVIISQLHMTTCYHMRKSSTL